MSQSRQMMETYLHQQSGIANTSSFNERQNEDGNVVNGINGVNGVNGVNEVDDPSSLFEAETPNNDELEDFKNQVNTWLDLDNVIAKLKLALRERKKMHESLTYNIGCFMSRYNIEDLNTKQGKIRCKVVDVKPSLTKKVIRERIVENVGNGTDPNTFVDVIFKKDESGVTQKITLRRLKKGGAMDIV